MDTRERSNLPNRKAHLMDTVMKIEKELAESLSNFYTAESIEKESDYSDAILSMDRAYAEGFSEALALALRIVKEAN